MKNIAIIGGGFSGSVTAINLARLSSLPLRITVINRGGIPCRGVAYSTRNGGHLLNVVARNMSALADQPDHFVEWLRTRCEYLDEPVATLRERFIPRRIYGDYLQNLFQQYSGAFAVEKEMQFDWIQGDVEDVHIEGSRTRVLLAGGRVIDADKVVLAAGNQPPSEFRLRGLDVKSPRYFGNPWIGWEEKLPSKDQDVLVIGTGLTMVDAVITLQEYGLRGRIIAVSRNGLLPLSHFKGIEHPDYLSEEMLPIRLRDIFSIFKENYRKMRAKNLNPAILVDKLRPLTQRIWQGFSLAEKKRFNSHFRTRWNVVRHRIAPEIHARLREAMAQKRLEVIKGRLRECEAVANGMKITVDSGGARRVLEVGAVVNCTGPRENYVAPDSRLFSSLAARGTVQVDDMNMGIKVAPNFAVLDCSGKPSETLYALGALMKGTLWETVAVPELRSQTFRLAETLATQLADHTQALTPITEVLEEVHEYSI
jgi:uncharacterized NAD(P)/FAD-binding protein YdhS